MNVVLLDGSPARGSRTRAALDRIALEFLGRDASAEVVDLLEANLPINDPEHHRDATQHPNENVRKLAQKVSTADVVVLGTPLYHGSYSGLLKVALDNLDGDAFAGKTVVIMSQASGMRGSSQAAQELVVVGRTMSGRVHGSVIGTCKADYDMVDGASTLISEEIINRIKRIVSEIVA